MNESHCVLDLCLILFPLFYFYFFSARATIISMFYRHATHNNNNCSINWKSIDVSWDNAKFSGPSTILWITSGEIILIISLLISRPVYQKSFVIMICPIWISTGMYAHPIKSKTTTKYIIQRVNGGIKTWTCKVILELSP